MSCTNCFSGCVSTTSDKCVKYTGSSIALLGIETGDTLESVEKAITDYLLTVYTGEGIVPTISPTDLCDIVSQYFPPVGDPTLVDILTAVIKAICAIEAEIEVERGRIDDIEATYTTGCISVTGDPGTHNTLQAVIVALCDAIGDITTLNNLFATCITTSTIDTYIQAYLNAISTSNLMNTKMVPYVIYPFYPSVSFMSGAFDINGVGIGAWQKVYLCNGYNGLTPDLRGRSLIGTTNMGGGAFDSAVDPGLGNPNYILGDKNGQNSVVLSPSQIAAHTHGATATVNDPGHKTTIEVGLAGDRTWDINGSNGKFGQPVVGVGNKEGDQSGEALPTEHYIASTSVNDKTGITVDVVNAENSGGDGHTNIHPVLACHYIMYIP